VGVWFPFLPRPLAVSRVPSCSAAWPRLKVFNLSRHQLKDGTSNSHHHEIWRLCLIYIHETGEGHLWPIGRDTDIQDLATLDLFMVRSTQISASNVVWLDISDTDLTELPVEIGGMRHLRKLDCHSNLLNEIPDSLCSHNPPPPLEYMAFNENQLQRVTPLITQLTKLKWLSLNGNKLTAAPDLPPNVERLSLHCNMIETLPAALGCASSVLAVSLHANRINVLPPSFLAAMTKCTTFSLMRNQIKELPDSIEKMQSLVDLWLYNNNISQLPNAICKLSSLKRLWIDRNSITVLPEQFGKLTSLEQLYASDNLLRTVPESLTLCTRLVRISLDGNHSLLLASLPVEIQSKLVPGKSVKQVPAPPPQPTPSPPARTSVDLGTASPDSSSSIPAKATATEQNGSNPVYEALFSIVDDTMGPSAADTRHPSGSQDGKGSWRGLFARCFRGNYQHPTTSSQLSKRNASHPVGALPSNPTPSNASHG